MFRIIETLNMDNFLRWKYLIIAGSAGLGVMLIRRRVAGASCESKASMKRKTVIVTGANSGIGKATATELAKRHARVILACRDIKRAQNAAKDIRSDTANGQLVIKKLDLASLASIKKFVQEIIDEEEHVDILINNAGIFQCPYSKTEDGFEMQMGVNHLGHFYLTNMLMDKLKDSQPSRVIIVSSGLHKFAKLDFDNLNSEKYYDKRLSYNNSKIANCLFARELARRIDGTGVSVYCLHPGMTWTNLARHINVSFLLKILFSCMAWLLIKTPKAGCQTVVYCAVAKELEGVNGRYYGNCQDEKWSEACLDDDAARKLWAVSEDLVGI